jgi:MFS family permease
MQAVAGSWIVLRLTGSSTFALSINNFAVQLPALLLMLYGGLVADRYSRRQIMVVTQILLMVLAFIVGALVATDLITFWLLLVCSVMVGLVTAFDLPAQQALVPELVEPREIPQAIALNQVIFNGSRMVGPAVAGVLIAVMGLASAYFANAISYVAVIASLLLLRMPKRAAAPAGHATGGMWQGVGHVWRSPLLRSLMGISGFTSLFVFPCLAVLSPAYVRNVLHLGPGTSALMFAATGGASMAGAFALLWVPAQRRGQIMLAMAVLSSLSLLVLATTSIVVVALLFFGLLSLGMGLLFGLNMTTIQEVTPNAIRGRVMGVSGLMFNGVVPLAAVLLGAGSELLGMREVYALCGLFYLVGAVYMIWQSGIVGRAPATLIPAAEPQTVAAG